MKADQRASACGSNQDDLGARLHERSAVKGLRLNQSYAAVVELFSSAKNRSRT